MVPCLQPLRKIETDDRRFFLQLLVGGCYKLTFSGLHRCSLLTEVRKHVPFTAEHSFADTLLYRERIGLFRFEA